MLHTVCKGYGTVHSYSTTRNSETYSSNAIKITTVASGRSAPCSACNGSGISQEQIYDYCCIYPLVKGLDYGDTCEVNDQAYGAFSNKWLNLYNL